MIFLHITNVGTQISPEDSWYVTWQIKKVVRMSLPEGNYQLIGWQATYVVWMVSPPSSCSVDSPEPEMKGLPMHVCVLYISVLFEFSRFTFFFKVGTRSQLLDYEKLAFISNFVINVLQIFSHIFSNFLSD